MKFFLVILFNLMVVFTASAGTLPSSEHKYYPGDGYCLVASSSGFDGAIKPEHHVFVQLVKNLDRKALTKQDAGFFSLTPGRKIYVQVSREIERIFLIVPQVHSP